MLQLLQLDNVTTISNCSSSNIVNSTSTNCSYVIIFVILSNVDNQYFFIQTFKWSQCLFIYFYIPYIVAGFCHMNAGRDAY